MECCGQEVTTPFCPLCGKEISKEVHGIEDLLAYVQRTVKTATSWVKTTPDDAVQPAQYLRQWKSWEVELIEVIDKAAKWDELHQTREVVATRTIGDNQDRWKSIRRDDKYGSYYLGDKELGPNTYLWMKCETDIPWIARVRLKNTSNNIYCVAFSIEGSIFTSHDLHISADTLFLVED